MQRLPSAIYVLLLWQVSSVSSISYKINAPSFEEEMVLTPNGYRPSRCVREVPSDSIISKEEDFIRITKPSGDEELLEYCNYKNNRSRSVEDSGWIVYASEASQTSYNFFSGDWNVPATPVNSEGQTVFFFLGFIDHIQNEIIQPVLQWGQSAAGGGEYWGVASWWASSNGNAVFSKLIGANSGESIYGNMTLGSDGTWYITALFGGYWTRILIDNLSPQVMATVTLEAYNIRDCNDYPSDGGATFSNMQLQAGNSPMYPSWRSTADFTDCNQGVNIYGASSVELTY